MCGGWEWGVVNSYCVCVAVGVEDCGVWGVGLGWEG